MTDKNNTFTQEEIDLRRQEAAKRALDEAEARKASENHPSLPVEKGGRQGLEPVRYGDWEMKGMAIDF